MRDAQIEDIAQAVGHQPGDRLPALHGKEELFALTLIGYLDELRVALAEGSRTAGDRAERVSAMVSAFIDYGMTYPAFVDCAQALMRRTGPELLEEIDGGAICPPRPCHLQLPGRAGAGSSTRASKRGASSIQDTTLLANQLYASEPRLAPARPRRHAGQRGGCPGIPAIHRVSGEQVKTYLVEPRRSPSRTRGSERPQSPRSSRAVMTAPW